jgi:hypothetical protein
MSQFSSAFPEVQRIDASEYMQLVCAVSTQFFTASWGGWPGVVLVIKFLFGMVALRKTEGSRESLT